MPLSAEQKERAARLTALEQLWDGTFHAARPSFWDRTVPLNERRPAIQSRLIATAGARLVGLVFGASKWPSLTPQGDAEALGPLVAELERTCQLPRRMRRALTEGLRCGTVCVLLSVRGGVPCVELVPARTAWPTLDADGTVTKLVIQYQYSAPDDAGRPQQWIYTREIDAQRDVVFEPVLASARAPEWIEKEPVPHGLGFVPVLWHRNRRDPWDEGTDGLPLFDGMQDEVLALDLAYSQAHRNAQYNGEPQMVLIGVDSKADIGKQARSADPKAIGWADALKGWAEAPTQRALAKAPGNVWRLESDGADAKMLESSGAGGALLQADVDRIRRMILDAEGIVMASPEQISANASAALMHELFAPMVDAADGLREEYGGLLGAILDMLLRMVAVVSQRGEVVHLRSLAPLAPALHARLAAWTPVEIALAWGDYFQPTWADVVQGLSAAEAATGGRALLTPRKAVELIAPLVGVRDVDSYVAELAAEQAPPAEPPQPPDLP